MEQKKDLFSNQELKAMIVLLVLIGNEAILRLLFGKVEASVMQACIV